MSISLTTDEARTALASAQMNLRALREARALLPQDDADILALNQDLIEENEALVAKLKKELDACRSN